jgi:hypothetical protein
MQYPDDIESAKPKPGPFQDPYDYEELQESRVYTNPEHLPFPDMHISKSSSSSKLPSPPRQLREASKSILSLTPKMPSPLQLPPPQLELYSLKPQKSSKSTVESYAPPSPPKSADTIPMHKIVSPKRLPEVIPMDSLSLDDQYSNAPNSYKLHYSYIDRNSSDLDIDQFLYIFSLTHSTICYGDYFGEVISRHTRSNNKEYPLSDTKSLFNMLCSTSKHITYRLRKKWKLESEISALISEYESIKRVQQELKTDLDQYTKDRNKLMPIYRAYVNLIKLLQIPDSSAEVIITQRELVTKLTGKPVVDLHDEYVKLHDTLSDIGTSIIMTKAEFDSLHSQGVKIRSNELVKYKEKLETIENELSGFLLSFRDELRRPIDDSNMYNIQIGYYTDKPTDDFDIHGHEIILLNGFMFIMNPETWIRGKIASDNNKNRFNYDRLKAVGMYWINTGGLLEENQNTISDKYDDFINSVSDASPNRIMWYIIDYRSRSEINRDRRSGRRKYAKGGKNTLRKKRQTKGYKKDKRTSKRNRVQCQK